MSLQLPSIRAPLCSFSLTSQHWEYQGEVGRWWVLFSIHSLGWPSLGPQTGWFKTTDTYSFTDSGSQNPKIKGLARLVAPGGLKKTLLHDSLPTSGGRWPSWAFPSYGSIVPTSASLPGGLFPEHVSVSVYDLIRMPVCASRDHLNPGGPHLDLLNELYLQRPISKWGHILGFWMDRTLGSHCSSHEWF